MPQSPFIQAPTKNTDDVDWVNPLKTYIAAVYQENPEEYLEECNTINRLRNDLRGAGSDSTGKDLLFKYHRQLELLDLRFPVDEAHVKISFNWYDAISEKATAQYSLAYEKACVIFNIAASLSAIAAKQTRSEPEGLKKAFHFLQCSAGVFTYINDNFLHAPSTDLNRDTVKVLAQLMLAQAQECILEKSLAEKKKGALIAKMAAHAADSYTNIADAFADTNLKGYVDKTWTQIASVKAKHMAALAQFNKALAAESEQKYGEVVARCTVAENYAKEASRACSTLISGFNSDRPGSGTATVPPDAATSLQEIIKASQTVISEKKTSASRDNDMIYHAIVPNADTLEQIDKLNMTKTIPFSELYSPAEGQRITGADIFHRLIPLTVHQSSSLYSEETAKVLRAEQEKSDIADAELTAALEYMRLPGALEKFRTRGPGQAGAIDSLAEPTSQVREMAKEIRICEGQGSLAELIARLESLRNRVHETVSEIGWSLDQEQRECEAMRVKYNDLWTQPPSGPLTGAIRQDLRQHRDTLDRAANSDKSALMQWDRIRNDIIILKEGENGESLHRIFAEAVVSSQGDNAKQPQTNLLDMDVSVEDSIPRKIEKVEECLSNLSKLKKDRMDTLQDLRTRIHQDDISQLLLLNKNSNIESQIFASELEKFRGHLTRLAATAHHQQAFIQELTLAYKSLLEAEDGHRVQSQWDFAEKRRNELTVRLKTAHDSYKIVKDGIRQAVQFYTDLSDLVAGLARTARGFVNQRADERAALLDKVEAGKSEREQKALKEQLSRYSTPPTPVASSPYPVGPNAPSMTGAHDGMNRLVEQTGFLRVSTDVTAGNGPPSGGYGYGTQQHGPSAPICSPSPGGMVSPGAKDFGTEAGSFSGHSQVPTAQYAHAPSPRYYSPAATPTAHAPSAPYQPSTTGTPATWQQQSQTQPHHQNQPYQRPPAQSAPAYVQQTDPTLPPIQQQYQQFSTPPQLPPRSMQTHSSSASAPPPQQVYQPYSAPSLSSSHGPSPSHTGQPPSASPPGPPSQQTYHQFSTTMPPPSQPPYHHQGPPTSSNYAQHQPTQPQHSYGPASSFIPQTSNHTSQSPALGHPQPSYAPLSAGSAVPSLPPHVQTPPPRPPYPGVGGSDSTMQPQTQAPQPSSGYQNAPYSGGYQAQQHLGPQRGQPSSVTPPSSHAQQPYGAYQLSPPLPQQSQISYGQGPHYAAPSNLPPPHQQQQQPGHHQPQPPYGAPQTQTYSYAAPAQTPPSYQPPPPHQPSNTTQYYSPPPPPQGHQPYNSHSYPGPNPPSQQPQQQHAQPTPPSYPPPQQGHPPPHPQQQQQGYPYTPYPQQQQQQQHHGNRQNSLMD